MAKNILPNKLRILHVTKWFPNRYDVQNGIFVQKHISCTSNFAEVKILAWLPSSGKTEIVESIENNLPITRHYFKRKTAISYKRSAFREYIRGHYNNKNLPDVVHLHVFSPDLLLVVNWAKKRKIPVVISEHWSGYMRGIFNELPFWKKWAYKKLGAVQQILPVSQFLEKHMKTSGIAGQFTVVPNVVAENPHRPKKLEKFTFLVVADFIDEVKNISGIITAFSEFVAVNDDCQLHLIGGGPDEKRIEIAVQNSGVANKINWFGRQKNDYVLQHLPSCHVLICNSRIESFGVVVLEAHAAGIPVISTLCGGPNEWLEKDDFPIEVDNQKELVEAMNAAFAAKNETVTFEMWKACLPEAVGEKLREVYFKLLSKQMN